MTKHVSLVALDPEQFLKLKETGKCTLNVPEWLFDLETAGHYLRRLKMVSLTLPCVTGPYTSIHCKLKLAKSSFRRTTDLAEGYDRPSTEDPSASDERFIDNRSVMEAIVTSTGQNDAGLFEPNMRDERYLPFEGAGAISTWELELPKTFRSFDYSTISDVILHLRYTARDGGEGLSSAATESAEKLLHEPSVDPTTTRARTLVRLFSLRHEFPSEWHPFVSSPPDAGGSTMTVDLATTRFPYFVQGRNILINKAMVFEKTSLDTKPRIGLGVAPGPSITSLVESTWVDDPRPGLAKGGSIVLGGQPGPWTFATKSDPNSVEDVFVIFEYSVN